MALKHHHGKLVAGSMFGHLDMTDLDFGSQTAAIHEGPPRPTALTPLALQATALTAGGPHHLQQFQHGFGSSQLHLSLHQLPLSHMPSTPLQHAAERQLQQLAQVTCLSSMQLLPALSATWCKCTAGTSKYTRTCSMLQWLVCNIVQVHLHCTSSSDDACQLRRLCW